MLSLGKMRNPNYYLKFTRYYLQGGEPPGKWIGKGAARLGLVGAVRKRHFQNIFQGRSPTGDALVKNADSEKRTAGIDLTFSAPKGVSVLWAISPKSVRRTIQRCHNRAVRRALRFLESELLSLRRGKQGIHQHSYELVAAMFQHSSSRLGDPTLHTHALVFNVGHAGGRWNAIDARKIYSWKMALGAIYRTELVHALWKTLSLPFELIKTWVEVKGVVPERLLRYFSKRSEDLRRAMRLHGSDSARASDIANLRTRTAKRKIPRPELFRQWRREAKTLGFGRPNIVKLLRSGHIGTPTDGFESLSGLLPLLTTAIHNCIEEISQQRSHFSRRVLIEKFLPRATEFKVSADTAIQAIDDVLHFDAEIEALGKLKGEDRFATRQTIAQEDALKKRVSQLKEQPGRAVPDDVLREKMLSHSRLAMEQLNAFRYLVDGNGKIKALAGVPGGGKTTVLAAAFDGWREIGLRVIGCSIMARAARNLEHKSGINSRTVRRLQIDLSAANQGGPASIDTKPVCGLPTYQLQDVALDSNTVLVVDEAGMVSTADTLDLLNRVAESGATLVLTGDEHQTPPIGAGTPFDAIKKELIHASLTEIRRFKDPVDKEALRLICEGKPEQALQKFADRGLLVEEDSPHEVRQQLVTDWTLNGGADRPQDHVILVCTNAQRQYFNDQIQNLRQDLGAVAREGHIVHGELLATGDRVMFLRNHRGLQVSNGDIGTVTMSEEPSKPILNVTLDSGRIVKVPLEQYQHLTRAYAATVHKFQGADVPNTYALLGGPMQSMELTYTQLSRHQNHCYLYTDKIEAGEKLERLCRQIRTPSRECLAIDLREQNHVKVTPPDSGDAPKPIKLGPGKIANALATPRLRQSESPTIDATAKHKTLSEQLPKHELAAKKVVEGNQIVPSSQQQPGPSEPTRRPYVKLTPPSRPQGIPEKSIVVPEANVSPTAIALDHSGVQAQSLERRSSDQKLEGRPERIILRPAAKQPLQQPIVGDGSDNAPSGEKLPAATNDGNRLRKLNVEQRQEPRPPVVRPVACDQPQVPLAPKQAVQRLVDARSDRLGGAAIDLAIEQFAATAATAKLSQRLIDADKTFDQSTAAPRPPLLLVVSNDRTKERTNVSESGETNAASSSTKRSSETLLEREQRIARENRAQNIHEHLINPQIDPSRSGPKPS